MAEDISLFPMITEELKSKMKFTPSEFTFYYVKDDEEIELFSEPLEEKSFVYKLSDEKGHWTPDEFNIGLKRRYSLFNVGFLFGKNGVACRDAILGLAVMWTSVDSKQRGIIPVGEFSAEESRIALTLEYEFLKAQLRGIVEFTTVIYIKNAGTPNFEEAHLANEYGFVLGEMDKFVLQLDGQGSIFPVYEVKEPGKPLWYIKCDWEDPTRDKFADTVGTLIQNQIKII